MDTDDLTKMAYRTIVLADHVSEFLPCELGVCCNRCSTEDEFLKNALTHVTKIQKHPKEYLASWEACDDDALAMIQQHIPALKSHLEKIIGLPKFKRGKTGV